MRIIVLMKTDRESPTPRTPRSARSVRWFLCAAVYGWAAVSSHAALTPLVAHAHLQNLAPVATHFSLIPGMAPFYPVFGLLAAVLFTHILRRRRLAQLAAVIASER